MNLVNYEKRKNGELFKSLKNKLDCITIQNYLPVYNKFFNLNETNYNSINFELYYYMTDIKSMVNNNENIYKCIIEEKNTTNKSEKNVFLKMAPLLDPFKFIIGKYNLNDKTMYNLPKYSHQLQDTSVYPKLKDENNSSYVDGVFSYISSKLIYDKNFIHGVDFYGSFLALKKNFKFDILDDLEYICTSDFFNSNKNKEFMVDDYSYLMENECLEKPPIKIDHSQSNNSALSFHSLNDDLFEDIFDNKNDMNVDKNIKNLDDFTNGLIDMTNSNFSEMIESNYSEIKSDSNCSSRTSHTSMSTNLEDEDEDEDEDSNGSNSCEDDKSTETMSNMSDEKIFTTIPKFPINIICMESCDDTFDNLIISNELNNDEWFSALMQIIMILITYQKCFSFTHNDLHTNNIMYNNTEIKYIYYCYNSKYYKVPTFGRIFKIIDFGRAIYKYKNTLFCSDSFQPGGDASTQYNIEPYFNEKKPRLEPNYSFDLCRLACSIFDYVIDDMDDLQNPKKCKPIMNIINEWCKDDNKMNILYKTNGGERYPDFKLYKMIARCVHEHTPHVQLERPEFKKYLINKKKINNGIKLIDIDSCNNI